MNCQLELQNDNALPCPQQADFELWAVATLLEVGHSQNAQLTLRVTHAEEVQSLNKQYRHQNKPTNVLSFPADLPPELKLFEIGDIIICAEIVEQEATAQNKDLQSHWAHMCVHGILHLLGYDHSDDSEAELMEALETKTLIKLGFQAPYE